MPVPGKRKATKIRDFRRLRPITGFAIWRKTSLSNYKGIFDISPK